MCCLCLNREQNKDMQVLMGGLSLNNEETTEQTISVEEAIVHENYRETPAAVYNDIGDLCLSHFQKIKIDTDSTNNIRI